MLKPVSATRAGSRTKRGPNPCVDLEVRTTAGQEKGATFAKRLLKMHDSQVGKSNGGRQRLQLRARSWYLTAEN